MGLLILFKKITFGLHSCLMTACWSRKQLPSLDLTYMLDYPRLPLPDSRLSVAIYNKFKLLFPFTQKFLQLFYFKSSITRLTKKIRCQKKVFIYIFDMLAKGMQTLLTYGFVYFKPLKKWSFKTNVLHP